MNSKAFSTLLLLIGYFSWFSQTYSMDLVKICPEFRTAYIQAYKAIDPTKHTNEMTYLYTGLNYGSSIIYSIIIETGINDCIKLLSNDTASAKQEMVQSLREFKNQIKSDEVYNPQTSTTYKRIPLRSGKTKLVKVPYDAKKCYKISVETQETTSEDEKEF